MVKRVIAIAFTFALISVGLASCIEPCNDFERVVARGNCS